MSPPRVRAKNPRRPPAPLTFAPDDVVSFTAALWRIHRVAGAHPSAWDELREYGPLPSMRWDPHPLPLGDHVGFGVSYAGSDVTTVVAESFQSRRVIALSGQQELVGWVPTRPLSLLNASSAWVLRNGASASLHAAPKSTCRAWAQAIRAERGDLDGLLVPSTMTGKPMVVLFGPAASAFPASPAFAEPLDTPLARALVVPAARELAWPAVRTS